MGEMDDIYVRRGRGPRRRGVGPLVLAVVVATAIGLSLYWYTNRPPAPAPGGAPAPARTHAPAAAAPATGSPPAAARSTGPAAPALPAAPAAPAAAVAVATSRVSLAASGLSDPSGPFWQEACAARERGDLAAARDKGLQALEVCRDDARRLEIETGLGAVHTDLVFTPAPMAEKEDYTVEAGDVLAAVAKKFQTTVELVQRSNGIKGDRIRPGDRLRVLRGVFSMVVDKSDNTLRLRLNDRFFKRYRVGTGKYEKTPTGAFRITERIPQPTWWRPDGKAIPYGDPDNVLGTHWLSLDLKGYGIHGTWEPETIGKSESAGCIRLSNSDIEELFTLVPVGAQVTIED